LALPPRLEGASLLVLYSSKNSIAEPDVRVQKKLGQLWSSEEGLDIAEWAIMLAMVLVLVAGTLRLVGSKAN
jgi:hypothetical protein